METPSIHMDFEQTALPQMPLLHNYALHLTMNSENAKDLLQETFLKAYRFWDKFEKGTDVRAWLYRIMKNSYINVYRKKVKEPKNLEFDENKYFQRKDFQGVPNRRYFSGESYFEIFGDEIAQSIESLPNTFKEIVLLSDVEDFSYSEIAALIDCPVGTVRSRLHRGRKQLKRSLSHYAMEHGYALKAG